MDLESQTMEGEREREGEVRRCQVSGVRYQVSGKGGGVRAESNGEKLQGLKARHMIARAAGPGKTAHKSLQP